MPNTNCLFALTSPVHAIQMILQVRHLNSMYVCSFNAIFNTVVLYLSIPPPSSFYICAHYYMSWHSMQLTNMIPKYRQKAKFT